MVSNKLSKRRKTRGTPPVCLSHRADLPYGYPYFAMPTEHARYIRMSALPPRPRPPYREITQRNLICHLYPHRSNDAATRCLAELRNRWPLFNGKKIIALAFDQQTISHRQIKRLLPADAEIFILPNDTRLRETTSFQLLLRQIQSTDDQTATFYCHGKGSSPTHNKDPKTRLAITYWAQRMFHHNLDHWPEVNQALKNHAAAGIYKIDFTGTNLLGIPTPTGGPHGQWFYAGTFYWFRHDQVFTNPRWSMIPDDSYAPETWLGTFIDTSQAKTLYQPHAATAGKNPEYYDQATHDPTNIPKTAALDKIP